MPVIAMQGIRGGVGTTSLTAGLAWALEQLGEPVLAIDFSPDNLLRFHFNMSASSTRGWARAELDSDAWHRGAMQYLPKLAFIPFGTLAPEEHETLALRLQHVPSFWRDNLRHLAELGRYRWVLLDLPAGPATLAVQQALAQADTVFTVIVPDANCHIRLHQQTLPVGCHFLVNHFATISTLQQDLHHLWLHTLPNLLPLVIHRDEAVAEALASKLSTGEHSPQSLGAEEMLTLANWCLINLTAEAP